MKIKKEIKLTKYQQKSVSNYRKLQELLGLDIERQLEVLKNNQQNIPFRFRQMSDQIIRSTIIMTYTEFHFYMDILILIYIFGPKGGFSSINKTNGGKIVSRLLERLPTDQKLKIIRKYGSLPNNIHNIIMKVNTLRNTFAHNFNVKGIKKHARLYGKEDIFTEKGLQLLYDDYVQAKDHLMAQSVKLSLGRYS